MAPLRVNSYFFIVIALCTLISSSAYGHAISMLFGTIEFPRTIKTIPQYEIFYEGQKIKPEVDGNKLLFNIPINRMLNRFYILFVENPSYVLKESDGTIQQNTIDYLKSGTAYRIFELQPQGTNTWLCVERLLADNLAIPDNTIIVYMPPTYIDKLVGGKGLQLPHVMIKENIMDLVSGSLEALQKKADELSIAAIDMSTFHVPAQEAMWIAGNKRIIVPTV